MTEDRVIARDRTKGDSPEGGLRPRTLDEFVGQAQVCENLRVFHFRKLTFFGFHAVDQVIRDLNIL